MVEKNTRRLFFALWPDHQIRQDLTRIQKLQFSKTGRLIHPADFHVTLQYLGQVNDETHNCVLETAGRITASPFRLTIDQSGYWARPRIAWIGTNEVPAELQSLVQQLGEKLRGCGFQPDTRVYQPHITLARKADRLSPKRLDHTVLWAVNSFSLVESISTPDPPRYHPLQTWEFK